MNTLKKVLQASRIKSVAAVGEEAFSAVWEVAKDPRASNIAFNVSKLLQKGVASYADRFTAEIIRESWKPIPSIPYELAPFIIRALCETGSVFSSEKGDLIISTVDGVPVAFTHDNLFAEPSSDAAEMNRKIAIFLLERCGPRYEIKEVVNKAWSEKGFVMAKLGGGVCPSPSLSEDELLVRLQKFKSKSITRSVLIHGAPGTGKTLMALSIAQRLAGSCMVVSADILMNRDLTGMLKMLAPEVLVVNDMDYVCNAPPHALSLLENISGAVKFLLVTANSIDIDPAMIRPGRFDDLLEVTCLGKVAFDALMMPTLALVRPDQKVLDELAQWPAAFLNELVLCVEALGPECFHKEYCSLKKRLVANQKPRDKKSLFTKE